MDAADGGVVRLTGVPARVFLESQDHQHDVIRELALIDIASRFHDDAAPTERVATLMSGILHEYSDVRTVTRQQAQDALDAGEETTTLLVPVRPGIVAALQRWLELVEKADELCAEGAFLTLPARPEVRDLRRWYAAAITSAVGQPGGADVAYPAAAHEGR